MYVEELIKEIKSGKDIKKIVSDRLAYLNSEEYQSNKVHLVTQSFHQVILWEGFIPSNQKVGNTENLNMGYLISGSNKIYEDFVLALKKYMENGKEIKHSYPIGYTKKFFLAAENQYSDIIDMYKEAGWSRTELREELQTFISEYLSAKKYIKSMDSFTDIYNFYNSITLEDIQKNQELKLFNEVYQSITQEGDRELPLDELKGTGSINMCTEHAMLYQNLSSFLGYQTIMAVGYLKNEGHNYNFVYDNNQWMLHDNVNGKEGYVNYKLGEDFTEKDLVDVILGNKKIEIPDEENLIYRKNDLVFQKNSDLMLEGQEDSISNQLHENKARRL